MKKFISTFFIACTSMTTYIKLYLCGYRGKAFLFGLIVAFLASLAIDKIYTLSNERRK